MGDWYRVRWSSRPDSHFLQLEVSLNRFSDYRSIFQVVAVTTYTSLRYRSDLPKFVVQHLVVFLHFSIYFLLRVIIIVLSLFFPFLDIQIAKYKTISNRGCLSFLIENRKSNCFKIFAVCLFTAACRLKRWRHNTLKGYTSTIELDISSKS